METGMIRIYELRHGLGRNKFGLPRLPIFNLIVDAELLAEWKKLNSKTEIIYQKVDITQKSDIDAPYKATAEKRGHFYVVVNGSGLLDERLIVLTFQINLVQHFDGTGVHGQVQRCFINICPGYTDTGIPKDMDKKTTFPVFSKVKRQTADLELGEIHESDLPNQWNPQLDDCVFACLFIINLFE